MPTVVYVCIQTFTTQAHKYTRSPSYTRAHNWINLRSTAQRSKPAVRRPVIVSGGWLQTTWRHRLVISFRFTRPPLHSRTLDEATLIASKCTTQRAVHSGSGTIFTSHDQRLVALGQVGSAQRDQGSIGWFQILTRIINCGHLWSGLDAKGLRNGTGVPHLKTHTHTHSYTHNEHVIRRLFMRIFINCVCNRRQTGRAGHSRTDAARWPFGSDDNYPCRCLFLATELWLRPCSGLVKFEQLD